MARILCVPVDHLELTRYGVAGIRQRYKCAAHTVDGMANVVRVWCYREGGFNMPSYDVERSRAPRLLHTRDRRDGGCAYGGCDCGEKGGLPPTRLRKGAA